MLPGMASVFLNGGFVDRSDATVSAFDAGLQHGVGLFETFGVTVSDGAARHERLGAHLARMVDSAAALGLSESLNASGLREAVDAAAARFIEEEPGVARWRIRLTVTGGDLNMLERGRGVERGEQRPTVLITGTPATAYPAEMFERGVGVVIGDLRLNPLDPFAGHKTLNYWGRLRELQLAAGKHASEAVLFTVTNHVAGGCVSNVVLVRGDEIVTPIARGEEQSVAAEDPAEGVEAFAPRKDAAVIPSPVLPGVTRGWVLDWARARGMGVQRRMVTIQDLLAADEVMLTNSSWGVLPVVRIEREAIGGGTVGPVARGLYAAWTDPMSQTSSD